MKKYIFYKDYFKNKNKDGIVLVSKVKRNYVIGPLLNEEFDEYSFNKRVESNSIYEKNIYKRCFKYKMNKLVDKYIKEIKSNEIIEIKNNSIINKHKILVVPRDIYE